MKAMENLNLYVGGIHYGTATGATVRNWKYWSNWTQPGKCVRGDMFLEYIFKNFLNLFFSSGKTISRGETYHTNKRKFGSGKKHKNHFVGHHFDTPFWHIFISF